jgi:hypothetical protein
MNIDNIFMYGSVIACIIFGIIILLIILEQRKRGNAK